MSEPLVIGFETSCDETGVGLVRGRTLLADALATSVDEHERFGGVVPEIASRAHLEAMVPTVHRAAEALVLVDRRREGVGEQRVPANQPDAGLVARRLEPDHERLGGHDFSRFITTASVPLGW